jgi:hypothetical protein
MPHKSQDCKYDVILTVHHRYYVEIKCQLDATDEFLLQILVLAQHVSGTIVPIIRSSRVLYKWLLPVVFSLLLAQHVSGTIMPIIRRSRVLYNWLLSVVFGAFVFKLSVCCGAEGYVSGLRAPAAV